MFRLITTCLFLRFCGSQNHSMADCLAQLCDVWSLRIAHKVLDPGFPRDDPTELPQKPARPIPTDVPVPEPMDVPAPDPIDVPVPEPGTNPTRSKPKPKNNGTKPRGVP
jgi:hypothetical protein